MKFDSTNLSRKGIYYDTTLCEMSVNLFRLPCVTSWWRHKWKRFPLRGESIHWWPVDSPQEGPLCGTFVFSLLLAWTNSRVCGNMIPILCVTKTEISLFRWNCHHWLHWKLSFGQLPVQPMMKISLKWYLRFSVVMKLQQYLPLLIHFTVKIPILVPRL